MIVVWRVTERCNLACPFCAYDRRLAGPRREAEPEVVRRFAAALADYGRERGTPVLVSWLGGEPLLWPPLAALTRHLVVDLGLRVSATTNGTALAAPRVRAHVVEHYAELTVSVDAPGAKHDALRGWPGGFARLRAAVEALAAARARTGRGPLLRANVVLMHSTVADFDALCLELADWGVDEVTFNQLGGNDRPAFYPAHRLTPADVDALAARFGGLRDSLARRGVRLAGGPAYLDRLRGTALGRRLPVADCGPGETFLFVDERGLVSPCSFTGDAYAVPVAEVATGADVAALPRRFAGARLARRAAACDDCPSTRVFAKFDAPFPSPAASAALAPVPCDA